MHAGDNLNKTVFFTAHDRSLNIYSRKYGLNKPIHENESAPNQYNAIESQQSIMKNEFVYLIRRDLYIYAHFATWKIVNVNQGQTTATAHICALVFARPSTYKKTLTENNIFATKTRDNITNLD